jgi:hypothetical protein
MVEAGALGAWGKGLGEAEAGAVVQVDAGCAGDGPGEGREPVGGGRGARFEDYGGLGWVARGAKGREGEAVGAYVY